MTAMNDNRPLPPIRLNEGEEKKPRITLEVEREVRDDMDRLVALMTASSVTEAVRRAVRVCIALYEAKRDGYTVMLTKKGQRDKEVVLL